MKLSKNLLLFTITLTLAFQPISSAIPSAYTHRWAAKFTSHITRFVYKHWKPLTGIMAISFGAAGWHLYKNHFSKRNNTLLNSSISDLAQGFQNITDSKKSKSKTPKPITPSIITVIEKDDAPVKTLTDILKADDLEEFKKYLQEIIMLLVNQKLHQL